MFSVTLKFLSIMSEGLLGTTFAYWGAKTDVHSNLPNPTLKQLGAGSLKRIRDYSTSDVVSDLLTVC